MDVADTTSQEIVQRSLSSTGRNSTNHVADAHKRETEGMVPASLDNPEGGPISEKWNVVFVISCLFAVLTDPLFLYVPLINQEVHCVRLDHKLMVAAVIFRSITDIIYIVKIIFQIYKRQRKETVMPMWRSYILLDILAVLPIPQVTILIYFTKMSGSRSLNTRMFLNFLAIIQYFPRLLRIYLACKEIKKPPEGKLGLWIKGGLNFLMYIFACNIMGGFWYFFSVQGMITCWQYACRNADGCKTSTFNCHDQLTNSIIKLLKDSCPINPSDETIFDFGVYLDALESGLVGSTNYSKKFSNCLWWGIKNLSSLGSDLQPSVNPGENLFAALTSIIGLLLFLYLIGKVQMYMQVESTSKEQQRWKIALDNMMITERKNRVERSKGPEIEQWLEKNYLPKRLMPEIMEKVVQVDLSENRDVDVENVQSILPVKLQNYIIAYKEKLEKEGETIEFWLSENHLPIRLKTEILEAVAQRSEFEQNGVLDMDTVLSLLPSPLGTYIKSYMQKVREIGEKSDIWLSENDLPINFKSDLMGVLLLTLEECKDLDQEIIMIPSSLPVPLEERIREYKQNVKYGKKIIEKGEEIDLWMLKNGIPKSHKSDIEEAIREELKKDENIDVQTFTSIYAATPKIQKYLPYNRLKKLKVLEIFDERIVKAICEHLKPVEYESGTYITEVGKPLELILFVEGTICFEKTRGGEYLSAPLVWGEELLLWPSSASFPVVKPLANDNLSTRSWMFYYLTTGLVLTAADLESIVYKFRPLFDPHTLHWLTRLKKVPKLQCMDEIVLKAIFLHLKQDLASKHPYVENQPIASMHFIIEGSVKFTRKRGDDSEELVLREGEVYGEELLDWVLDTSFPTLTPFATHTAVFDNEAVQLSITAAELKSVAMDFRSYFTALHKESQPDLKTIVGLTVLKRVPKLKTMAEEVLEAISRQLQLRSIVGCEHIIEQGKPIDMILFVLKGKLRLYTSESDYLEEERFFGEELIDWLAKTSDNTWPLSTYYSVTSTFCEQTQLLVLMGQDLETVMSNFKSQKSQMCLRNEEKESDNLIVFSI